MKKKDKRAKVKPIDPCKKPYLEHQLNPAALCHFTAMWLPSHDLVSFGSNVTVCGIQPEWPAQCVGFRSPGGSIHAIIYQGLN